MGHLEGIQRCHPSILYIGFYYKPLRNIWSTWSDVWSCYISPVILWFDLGLIAREGFSNVSYSKKCALQRTKSLKKFSEGKA